MKKLFASLAFMAIATGASFGQAISQNGGSIQGTVTDPNGAALPGATVVISSPETGYSHTLVTDKAGVYSLGPLVPGAYKITVTAPAFQRLTENTVVRVGTVTNGNEKLSVGSNTETVEVNAGEIQVNTDQIGVAGVVTKDQIDTLPINGRNILDIAQIQPGVILQSGQDFDPTKTGYSALGVNGQNGRSTRILVDGQDISDETVGTVVFNVPSGAIGEFQLNRSTQDVSGEVTSTGQVLMATQSGTNRYHGNLFYNFQDNRAGFANVNGLSAPFQRNQFGGYMGGFIIKDKLFFFGGAERIKQYDSSPVNRTQANFAAIYTQYPVVPDPFKDTFSIGRLDYYAPHGIHLFARATYSNNIGFGTAGQPPYALFSNQDNVPAIVGGADFVTGKFTHSVRVGYLKFINNLVGAAGTLGSSVYNPSAQLGVPFEFIGSIYAGSGNEDAPQNTYQSSKSFRYDGTWTKGKHSIKFGAESSRIMQGGFAAFYSTMLSAISTTATHTLGGVVNANNPDGRGCNAVIGAAPCTGDPLNGYQPYTFYFGNGQGSGSERPAFSLPGGGNFSYRLAAYVGDTWKVNPQLTLVAGLRWSADTDRANQDLPEITCGNIDPDLYFTGCDASNPNASLLNFFGPGYGLAGKTQQNWGNFGPQVGFVYSPGSHKLSLRGGAGVYFESDLFNNQGNARAQQTMAEFPAFNYGSATYTSSTFSLPGYVTGAGGVLANGTPCNIGGATDPGCITLATIFHTYTEAQAIKLFAQTDALYKAAAAVPQPNNSFIGFINGDALQAASMYSGNYKTPYSIQMNGGMQYELKKGLLLSVDFLHQATMKMPLTVDTNHNGAARTLNTAAAVAAIKRVTGGAGSSSDVATYLAAHPTASIDTFANAGLDSGKVYEGGYPSFVYRGQTPNTGAAFAGTNANVGTGAFILPLGKSAYDALQIVLQQQKHHPLPGIVESNAQISYNLSRIVTNSGGGSNGLFAGYTAWNNDCVNCLMGRSDSDRTNQVSLSGSFTVKYGLQVGLVGHFFSAPPSTLTLGGVTGSSQIYKTDINGDGYTGDLLPGQLPGSYGHSVNGKTLQSVITQYNATQAGQLTPAGQALVNAGLMTRAQLVQLGATLQPLYPGPANAIQSAMTRTLDASFAYPIGYLKRFREGLVLTPSVRMYNVANMGNFSAFGGTALLQNADAGTASISTALNNTNSAAQNNARVLRGAGNGTFDQGGPRTTEFGLKLDF